MKRIVYLFVSILVLNSCAKMGKNDHKNMNLEEINTEMTVHLSVGETVLLNAQTNPSTGYNWQMVLPLNSSVEILKEIKPNKATDEIIVGAPSQLVYYVTGKSLGESIVEFGYGRAWEGLVKNPKKIKFIVK